MTLFRRLWYVLTRWRRVRDLDDEMRLHVAMRAAANQRQGLAPDEAQREAKRRFGNPLKLREQARDMWGFSPLERTSQDFRSALRRVLHYPMWTLIIVSTLAIGIGANTSVFTLVDTMLFKPAPWNSSGRLVWISSVSGRSSEMGGMSYADYLAYRDRATTLSGVLAYAGNGVGIGGGGQTAEHVNAGLVSTNYFDVIGIHAAIGRTFVADDGAGPRGAAVVVLSDAFWREHFRADPAVIDRVLTINGRPFTIVGVAPRGFTGVAYADNAEQVWVPLAMQPLVLPDTANLLTAADTRWLRVVARLGDGRTLGQADAEMSVIARQLNSSGTPPDREKGVQTTPVRGGMLPSEQRELEPIFGLIAIVPALVLLVSCANVANVLMAGNISRRKELAMRQAIGASRARVIGLLLMESVVLACLSAAAGFAVSFGVTAVIVHYGKVGGDFSSLLTPDRRALVATTAIAILTTVFFGLAPALTATKFDVLPVLQEEGITSTPASGRAVVRRAFVIAQVTVSLILLIVAGLFVQSLLNAMRVDPGFEPHGVVTVSFDTDLLGYTASRRAGFVTEFVDRASVMPGVVSAALTNILPVSGESYGTNVVAEETTPVGPPTPQRTKALLTRVSPRYFETLRLPVLRGREFTIADTGAPVAIVNETLAQQLWPGTNPIGKRIRVAEPKESWRDIIGIARDSKYHFLTESQRAACYLPFRQDARARASLVIRTVGDPRAALSSLTRIGQELDPDLPLFNVQTFDEQIRHTAIRWRATASLMSVLSSLSLLLAAVGLYGVAAHNVSLRVREVGIRMSLGARATDMFRMVVGENLSLALIGIAIGLGISAAGSRVLTSFVFGVTPTDVRTFIGCAIVLCFVTVVASYIPARRAARLDPLTALRHQ
jgi:predicted permease